MNKQNLTIPIAIIIAGMIMGGAIYLDRDSKDNSTTNDTDENNIVDTDVPNFSKCLNDGRYVQNVEDNLQDGIKAGVNGTPHSIVINDKGEKFAIRGALPYEQVKTMLDQIIAGNAPLETRVMIEGPKPVDSSDHILGNPNAPITIIEFADTECPFCKSFHETMVKIMDEYGKTGQVRWVYRHFPLDQIHSKARKEAEATECATEQGGNEKFWEYINKVYEITTSNNTLDPVELLKIAKSIGLD